MRIVTWNCHQALRNKLGPLLDLSPDVAVIQECERSFQPPNGYYFFWHGIDPDKGLGILSNSTIVPLQHPVVERSAFFAPVFFPELGLKLVGVWAFNRRTERFEPPRSGMALEAVNQLSDWLEGDRCAVVGDFNNNVSWDKKQKSNNFKDIAERLALLGLSSAYHRKTKEEFGKESAKTHYWRYSDATKYHIDYCFVHHSLKVAAVEVPAFEAWRSLSDHVPVITDIGDA